VWIPGMGFEVKQVYRRVQKPADDTDESGNGHLGCVPKVARDPAEQRGKRGLDRSLNLPYANWRASRLLGRSTTPKVSENLRVRERRGVKREMSQIQTARNDARSAERLITSDEGVDDIGAVRQQQPAVKPSRDVVCRVMPDRYLMELSVSDTRDAPHTKSRAVVTNDVRVVEIGLPHEIIPARNRRARVGTGVAADSAPSGHLAGDSKPNLVGPGRDETRRIALAHPIAVEQRTQRASLWSLLPLGERPAIRAGVAVAARVGGNGAGIVQLPVKNGRVSENCCRDRHLVRQAPLFASARRDAHGVDGIVVSLDRERAGETSPKVGNDIPNARRTSSAC
jgi:hypothetical protein